MMGTFTPCMRRRSWIFGSASAEASLFTVTRTSSEPARASAAICVTEDCTSAVSVFVIDWTTTGASEPTRTPPTFTVTDCLRRISAMGNSDFIMLRGVLRRAGAFDYTGFTWLIDKNRIHHRGTETQRNTGFGCVCASLSLW